MAIINKTGIVDSSIIQAEHVTRTIDALSGIGTDTIVATGSFSGSFVGDGSQLVNDNIETNEVRTNIIRIEEFILLPGLDGDPSPLQEGQIWYREDLYQLRAYLNGNVAIITTSTPF